MNPEDKEKFDAIVAKDAASLTEPEIAVLRSRSSYLTDEQRDRFAALFSGTSAPEQPPNTEDEEPKSARKKKDAE